MKKLKCESCGANLKVDESKEFAVCEYCDLKYKLNEDKNVNVNINLDDDMKNNLKLGAGMAAGIGVFQIVIFVTIILVFGAVVAVNLFKYNQKRTDFENKFNEVEKNIEDAADLIDDAAGEVKEKVNKKINKDSFNSGFELYSGTSSKIFVEAIIDKAVTNNKKNKDQLVTVIFNDINTTNPDDIINIKSQLENRKYEVILDYDDLGYVEKITIR